MNPPTSLGIDQCGVITGYENRGRYAEGLCEAALQRFKI